MGQGQNCLHQRYNSDYGRYTFANDYPCSQALYFICELDELRQNFQESGIEEVRLTTAFTIVKEPNVNYTSALEACQGPFSGSSSPSGGRLAGPTNFREMKAINEKITNEIKRNDTRWWIGAKRSRYDDMPRYTSSGDYIPANLREWDTGNGGFCMVYDHGKKKFGWEFCNIGEANKPVDGYICQDMD